MGNWISRQHASTDRRIQQTPQGTLQRGQYSEECNETDPEVLEAQGVHFLGLHGFQRDLRRAVPLLQLAANAGRPTAAALLAQIYVEGPDGCPRDYRRALELNEFAAARGNFHAMENLAHMFQSGLGVQKNPDRAVQLYEQAIELNNSYTAMHNLARMLHIDQGFPLDVPRAVDLYQRAISTNDHVPSMTNLGLLLYRGDGGIERDFVKAVDLFNRAIEKEGDILAMRPLGQILSFGEEGVPADPDRARVLLQIYIDDRNDSNAMCDLARLLFEGPDGIEKDSSHAITLLEKAIQLENRNAMEILADMLLRDFDESTRTDPERAIKLYQTAIKKGAGRGAKVKLAAKLRTGDTGVLKDIPQAINLYKQAIEDENLPADLVSLACLFLAEDSGEYRNVLEAKKVLETCLEKQQYAPAMNELAVLLERGESGVQKDLEQANRLFTDAVELEIANRDVIGNNNVRRHFVSVKENYHHVVVSTLREVWIRPCQCFVLTLGGGARGKTSVVRSLREQEFIPEHNPTELACLDRFHIGQGKQNDHELEELVFNCESLLANLSRATSEAISSVHQGGGRNDGHNSIQSLTPHHSLVPARPGSVEAHISTGITTSQENIVESENVPSYGTITSDTVLHEQSSLPWEVPTMSENERYSVIERARRALTESKFPLPKGDALLQCWDLGGQKEYFMAHSLFVKYASVILFVIDLEKFCGERKIEEVQELCRWMQLAHSLSHNPAVVRPIVVGTRKDKCSADEQAVWNELEDLMVPHLGNAAYNEWVKTPDPGEVNRQVRYVAIENSTAVFQPVESGLEKLKSTIKEVADEVVSRREKVPARWVALIETLEKKDDAIFLTKSHVNALVDGFPAFDTDKNAREIDAEKALVFYQGLGRVVLFKKPDGNYYVFMNPNKIVDFVRQVTGPERLIKRRLRREEIGLLQEKGLLGWHGLKILWSQHSEEIQNVMLDVLCEVDLILRLRSQTNASGKSELLLGFPALLQNGNVQALEDGYESMPDIPGVANREETEVRMMSKFDDCLPPGLAGKFIAHLSRTIGREKTKAHLVRGDAVMMELEGAANVLVVFNSQKRQVSYKVRSREAMTIGLECLKSLDNFLNDMQVPRKHVLLSDCVMGERNCNSGDVEFEFDSGWIQQYKNGQYPGDGVFPDMDGKCCSCKKRLRLSDTNYDLCLYDVFISHSGLEKFSIAYPLHDELQREGLRVFLDRERMRATRMSNQEQLEYAMKRSKMAVFIISENFKSKWPMWEAKWFHKAHLEARKTGGRGQLLYPLFYTLSMDACRNVSVGGAVDEEGKAALDYFTRRSGLCNDDKKLGVLHGKDFVMRAAEKILGGYEEEFMWRRRSRLGN